MVDISGFGLLIEARSLALLGKKALNSILVAADAASEPIWQLALFLEILQRRVGVIFWKVAPVGNNKVTPAGVLPAAPMFFTLATKVPRTLRFSAMPFVCKSRIVKSWFGLAFDVGDLVVSGVVVAELVVVVAEDAEILIVIDLEVEPRVFVAVRVVLKVPLEVKMCEGEALFELLPSPNVQLYEVALIEVFAKSTNLGASPDVVLTSKLVSGRGRSTITVLLLAAAPSELLAVRVTV